MKKVLFIFFIAIVLVGCKKTKFSPEGPTDIRVENLSDQPWAEVILNTADGIDTVGNIFILGNIAAGGTSDYRRFTKAFSVAEITATINGEKYSTGTVNYTYLTYIGQAKITYRTYIKNAVTRLLAISDCRLDAPLDGK